MPAQPLNALVTKIRAAHPGAYDDMDDATLTKAVLAKYPQYSDLAAPGYPKFAPQMETSMTGVLEGGPTDTNPSGSKVPRSIQNAPDALGDLIGGLTALGAAAPAGDAALAGAAKLITKHPVIGPMVMSVAIDQARKIPGIGKLIPPYSEMLPYLLSGHPKAETPPVASEPLTPAQAAEGETWRQPQAETTTPAPVAAPSPTVPPPVAPEATAPNAPAGRPTYTEIQAPHAKFQYDPSRVPTARSPRGPGFDADTDAAIEDAMRADLARHGRMANAQANREFAANNSVDTPKGVLQEQANNSRVGSQVVNLAVKDLGSAKSPIQFLGGHEAYKEGGSWFIRGGDYPAKQWTAVSDSNLKQLLDAAGPKSLANQTANASEDLSPLWQQTLDRVRAQKSAP